MDLEKYLTSNAIRVNSLLVRPNDLQQRLGQMVHRFVSVNDDELYQFQHIGTATGLKYRGRYFVVATDHQRKLGTYAKWGIVDQSGTRVITASNVWFFTHVDETDVEENLDFCVFEFEPAKSTDRLLTTKFLVIDGECGVGEKVGKIALNIGYPSRLQTVDYYGGEVNLVLSSNFVELVDRTESNDVFAFRTISSERYFEDGMSGSPLFEMMEGEEEFWIKWLGVVSRGGAESRVGRAIDAKFILKEIERMAFGQTSKRNVVSR